MSQPAIPSPHIVAVRPSGAAPPVYVSGPICAACLDTGFAPSPHSDEATETCACAAGKRLGVARSAYRPAPTVAAPVRRLTLWDLMWVGGLTAAIWAGLIFAGFLACKAVFG